MYISEERRKELKERYKDNPAMQSLEIDQVERMDDWEDWDIIAIVDDMPGHGKPVSEADKQAIMENDPNPYKPYDVFSESDWMEAWDGWQWDLLDAERDAEAMEEVLRVHPVPEDGIVLDDTMQAKLIDAANKDSHQIEKERKPYIGKVETIQAYRKVLEKFPDEPHIAKYIERCIENGGGDPAKLEEDLGDPEFREFIKGIV